MTHAICSHRELFQSLFHINSTITSKTVIIPIGKYPEIEFNPSHTKRFESQALNHPDQAIESDIY